MYLGHGAKYPATSHHSYNISVMTRGVLDSSNVGTLDFGSLYVLCIALSHS